MGNRIAALIAIGAIMTISIWSLGCSAGTEDRSDGSGHGQKEDGHAGSAVWTYTGSKGAEYWGSLSPDYAVCTNGRMQSPIDIVDAFPAKGPELIFDYKPSPLRIVNNGHTVQVNYGPGSVLTVAGKPFGLLQFHFHAPSEHAIAGSPAPMEVHFVHGDADGSLAVVGVMMQAGRRNEPLAPVFANMPDEAGPEVEIADTAIDASAMLPSRVRRLLSLQGLADHTTLQPGCALVCNGERDRSKHRTDWQFWGDLGTERETAAGTERPFADLISVGCRRRRSASPG